MVLIVCVILAFIDKMEAFKKLWMFYLILGVIALMLLSGRYDDYGFLLLFVAMLVLIVARRKE